MGKYKDIVESPWGEATVYAESIPHLLHWDLAFLWILEKQPHLRPHGWHERIEAWKYLLSLFLMDELAIREEGLTEPFLSLAKPFGVSSVSWVSLKNTRTPVGIISPTVLVRPLPDYQEGSLSRWVRTIPHPREHRPEELAHFIHLLIGDLDRALGEASGDQSIRRTLITALRNEFEPRESLHPPGGQERNLQLLGKIRWVRDEGAADVQKIRVWVIGKSNGGRVYRPRCNRCDRFLMRSLASEPTRIPEIADTVEVICGEPNCGQSNVIPLANLFLWMRTNGEVISWERSELFFSVDFPPSPAIRGQVVSFEWSATQLNGEPEKRFLRFEFPERRIRQMRIGEIFYSNVLVPGDFDSFIGLPVRLEWLDALSAPASIVLIKDSASKKITYQNIGVKGLPEATTRTYLSNHILFKPDISIGLYPKPGLVPPDWKWFRIFLHGQDRKDFRISFGRQAALLPWLAESAAGVPKYFSVASNSGDAGVTYAGTGASQPRSSQSPVDLYLGIDFGTTNTIVYFLPPGKKFDDLMNAPTEYCVEPGKFVELIEWMAKGSSDDKSAVGDFLPEANYGSEDSQRYIIPSLLWDVEGGQIIRWNPLEPVNGARALKNFKIDIESDYGSQRYAFVREALLLALPWILEQTDRNAMLTSWRIQCHLGFAFPLALRGTAREKMRNLVHRVRDELKEVTGLEFDTNAVSESSACKTILGDPNSTDAFLVADMGGGTMDLALFTGNNVNPDQIGSILYAGESFINSLAENKSTSSLNIGDLIRQSQCNNRFGQDKAARKILDRFWAFAFEYLRTMIAAYRRQRPDQAIHLVLAGNGWHLAEHFIGQSGDTRSQIYRNTFGWLVKAIGDEKLQLSDRHLHLPSSKHLVAVGALKHARNHEDDQLDPNTPTRSKLPAGRKLIFSQQGDQQKRFVVEWFDLVGEPVSFQVPGPSALKGMDLEIGFSDMPELAGFWRDYFLKTLDITQESEIPYPSEMLLRDSLKQEIQGRPNTELQKGPLQLILENHWVRWLGR